jgi:predicted nucleic-acid-binding Zn-ribbon protein
MFGKIEPQDILSMTVQAAIKIYCAHCRQHVFYLKRENSCISIDNLAPLQGWQVPINFDCPKCGQDIRAYAPEPTLKTDKGYWHG